MSKLGLTTLVVLSMTFMSNNIQAEDMQQSVVEDPTTVDIENSKTDSNLAVEVTTPDTDANVVVPVDMESKVSPDTVGTEKEVAVVSIDTANTIKPGDIAVANELAETEVAGVVPVSVQPLLYAEGGRNDSNPIWFRNGNKLSFERSTQGKKEILITTSQGELLQKIYVQSANNDELAFLLPGVTDSVSYNAGISWSPDGEHYVFMSNGGEGNYDVYLGNSLDQTTERLTDYEGKDGHAQWSPVDNKLVYVSGRSGSGDLFMLDMLSRESRQLTQATSPFLYPEWAPDGRAITVISGKNENHDIYLLKDISDNNQTLLQITDWEADDLRPMWSPDGKKIAFYTNFNQAGDSKLWAIAVVDVNQTMPISREVLVNSIIANNVIPDIERGPAWLPDSQHVAYVKNSRQEYNPIYIANSVDGSVRKLLSETRMNHDVTCSKDGVLAFRTQIDQWDQIYTVKLP